MEQKRGNSQWQSKHSCTLYEYNYMPVKVTPRFLLSQSPLWRRSWYLNRHLLFDVLPIPRVFKFKVAKIGSPLTFLRHQRRLCGLKSKIKQLRSSTSFPSACPISRARTIRVVGQRTRPYCSPAMARVASVSPRSGPRWMPTIWTIWKGWRVSS